MAASASVGDLVLDLAAAFADARHLYAQWRACREHANHYRTPTAGPASSPRCALAASLALGQVVREVYAVGYSVLGGEFTRGDHTTRRTLTAHRDRLAAHLPPLRAAVPAAAGPLDLRALLQASEAARVGAVQALVDGYRRVALTRTDVPRELPVPRRPQVAPQAPPQVAPPPSARWLTPLVDDDDARTTAWSVLSGPLVFQSEPPSPPLTPLALKDLPPVPALPEEHAYAPALPPPSEYAPSIRTTVTTVARPKNSVFNIFCPGAMALQVDVRRPVPADEQRCRWCGFRWGGEPEGGMPSAPPLLKEGFHLSRRFLAKSHCEGPGTDTDTDAHAHAHAYGCVLCTSTGLAQTYPSAEALRGHINAAHSKWQMLHDRDLT